jgi:hypothetical protein
LCVFFEFVTLFSPYNTMISLSRAYSIKERSVKVPCGHPHAHRPPYQKSCKGVVFIALSGLVDKMLIV